MAGVGVQVDGVAQERSIDAIVRERDKEKTSMSP